MDDPEGTGPRGRRRRRRSARRRQATGRTADDADLLGQLPLGGRLVGLAGRDDAADADVPAAGPEVLVLAAPVDEQRARSSTCTTTNTARWRSRRARISRRVTVATTTVVVVDDVDQLVARISAGVRGPAHGRRAYHGPMTVDTPGLREEANDLLSGAVELRRTLHQWPELGNDLPVTQEHVLGALEGLPLDVTVHETTSGIAAMLTGGRPGPTILLRGDMDALPLHEDTGLDFASRVERHDARLRPRHAHGDARRRGQAAGRPPRRPRRPGAVHVPARRGGPPRRPVHARGGPARRRRRWPTARRRRSPARSPSTSRRRCRRAGSAARAGSIMASADRLMITVTGKGGHASEPHRALDPIPVACEMVQALQMMVTRTVDVFDPSVVTVGRITAGTTNNVIPETAEIEGTIRAVSERTRAKVHDGIRRVVDGIAAAHGCAVGVDIEHGYPVTVNDGDFAEVALGVADDVVGADKVVRLPHPVMGAEDWSYVLQQVPGAMMFLGGTPLDRNLATAAPNHSNRVVFDEQAMVDGIATYAAVALHHLA